MFEVIDFLPDDYFSVNALVCLAYLQGGGVEDRIQTLGRAWLSRELPVLEVKGAACRILLRRSRPRLIATTSQRQNFSPVGYGN